MFYKILHNIVSIPNHHTQEQEIIHKEMGEVVVWIGTVNSGTYLVSILSNLKALKSKKNSSFWGLIPRPT